MKIIFDHNTPWGLRKPLDHHEVSRAWQLGWAQLMNGDLLQAAEDAGFQLFITGDRNIRYQQNVSRRRIAIIELTTTRWPAVCLFFNPIVAAVDAAVPGSYIVVECRPVGDARDKSRRKIL